MAKSRVNKIEPPGARLVRALKQNNLKGVQSPTPHLEPKLKKDGTPWTPWADEVALRMQRKEEREARNGPDDRTNKCIAHTSGVHGPKRPCDNRRMLGQKVCRAHGGSTKLAKAAAKHRLVDELDPTINRLIEIRDQDEHMPSALGAAVHLMNRILGKADATERDKGAGAPVIQIGIALGGLPIKAGDFKVLPSTTRSRDDDEDAVEGEVEE